MDKPNDIEPQPPKPLGFQSDVCPKCSGVPALLPGGCDACHGTGRKSQKILPFPTSPTPRPPSPALITCDCVRTGRLLYGGDATPCPLCGGAGKISQERATEAYHLILRHQHELTPLPNEQTQPIGKPLALVLQQSRYGAYCVIAPTRKDRWRLYLEYAAPNSLDFFHVYAQSALEAVGPDARMLVYRNATIGDLLDIWPMMPSPDAPVWWPLPKEAAFRLAAEARA